MEQDLFSPEIYDSWKSKQIQKYRELEKDLSSYLGGSERALDIGIGKAWFWKYLKEKGYDFEIVKGVDVSKEATEPEKENIKYTYSCDPSLKDEFDLIVLLDSAHLIEYKERLPELLEESGLILQSVPLRYRESVRDYRDMKVVEEGEVGEEEVDYFSLQRG